MSYANLVDNYGPAVQADLRKTQVQMKQQHARTYDSFNSGSGARGAEGRLAGLEIPYYRNVPDGNSAFDPLTGRTSYEPYFAATMRKMYVGLAYLGFSTESEWFHDKDGTMPETPEERRERAMRTYYQHINFYICGVDDGRLAIVSVGVGAGGGTITLANDNTGRGRSKGSLRLRASASTAVAHRVEYESYNATTDALGATFFVTSKASALTAVVVITDGGTITAGEVIVRKGHYKRVPYGVGYHFDNASRVYQGVNTAQDTFLNSDAVDGGNALVTPTAIGTAKTSLMTAANDPANRKNRVFRMSWGNKQTLSAFGYELRQYAAEKGQATTTYGIPYDYEDEDTGFMCDSDYEDAYIDGSDRKSYFIYRLAELSEVTRGKQQWQGLNLVGSLEFFNNFAESFNLAWDARGDDGKGGPSGQPNSSVVISNITIPDNNQVARGQSLV